MILTLVLCLTAVPVLYLVALLVWAFLKAGEPERRARRLRDWQEMERKRNPRVDWGPWGSDRQAVAKLLKEQCDIVIDLEK